MTCLSSGCQTPDAVGALQLSQRGLGFDQKNVACIGQRDRRAFVAVEQSYAEIGFEPLDLLAEHRLCDFEPVGCTSEVQVFGQCDEQFELPAIDHL